ncbi:hypothetical protein [Phenylobacterium montanum]|uniref:Uncharacterized protein n=1 Tax=Phenylobacterium montanum TaxID=2823693 RepID=A0A975G2Z6_9CAUL|nr:hypothetical protein [Caulobacter sp. S6]QUD89839.1 hypothetical protein KCG34_08210 [Caulobacter sp. S6]
MLRRLPGWTGGEEIEAMPWKSAAAKAAALEICVRLMSKAACIGFNRLAKSMSRPAKSESRRWRHTLESERRVALQCGDSWSL